MLRFYHIAPLVIAGCLVETFTSHDAGTVYECAGPDGSKVEWCSVMDAAELGEASGRYCQRSDRPLAWFANALGNGCVYNCDTGEGCNALGGCYCEWP